MSQIKKTDEINVLDQKCKKLLKEDGIRFIGIINNMGKQIVGGYKEGITPFVDKEEHKMCIQHALGLAITKDLDESLGSIDYITTKRKKVVMITIPVQKHIILISAEHSINIEDIVEKAKKIQFFE